MKSWAALLAAAALLVSAAAAAEETPLVIAGAVYESASATIAPIGWARLPLAAGGVVLASQIGWTSGLAVELFEDRHWRWTSGLAFTPVRAHLSHDLYDADGRERRADFDATSLRLTSGEAWGSRHVAWEAHLFLQKEWLARLAPELRASFRAPFVGLESQLTIQSLRAEDVLSSRIEGVRAVAKLQLAAGDRRWAQADLRLSLGRRWGIIFPALEAGAFAVSFEHPVTDVVVGGSWDLLGPLALMGHPLGAFRLSRGASFTGRFDVVMLRDLSVGVRQSLLLGAATVHDGLALVVEGEASGVHLFVGVASPDRAVWHGEWSRTTVFGGANAALLFLP